MGISPEDVEEVFRASGALQGGHFVLSSGRHSPTYLEKFQVLQWPKRTERLCAAIVERVRALGIETVAGPTTGGIIVAHEVGRQLDVRAVYAERNDAGMGPRASGASAGSEGARVFRRGFQLKAGERVLIVDDIMSTGGSIDETIAAVRAAGATVVGAAVLVDRSGGTAHTSGIPHFALWEVAMETYDPASCPQCAAGEPIRKPGTTPAPAGAAAPKGTGATGAEKREVSR